MAGGRSRLGEESLHPLRLGPILRPRSQSPHPHVVRGVTLQHAASSPVF